MTDSLSNSLFMKACRGEATPRAPIWLMRQAGRYMPEYRAVREKVAFLDLCKTPELACQVTVEAQRRLGVDAAILFADLLPILEPMGFGLDYPEKIGPVVSRALGAAADVDRVVEHDPRQTMPFVAAAVRMIRAELAPDIPLIGFSGAPFTLAAYALEGGGSRNFERAKRFMYDHEAAWNDLMGKLSRTVVRYSLMQTGAGCQAFQLFDSWVGCLDASDYRRYVLPHSRAVIDGIRAGAPSVPIIHFGVHTATLLPDMHRAGADVLGFDWRTPMTPTWSALECRAVQGNLDPCVLFADRATLLRKAREVLTDAGGRPGHIFNLGHGILPATPVDNVLTLVECVKNAA